jgi:hypothetical protein
MAKTLIIQAKEGIGGIILPMHDFGYTAIEAVNFSNWIHNTESEDAYSYLVDTTIATYQGERFVRTFDSSLLSSSYVPIGSVEYVQSWLKAMGARTPKPLNIPKELWSFVRRKITTVSTVDGWDNCGGYLKDSEDIKSCHNGVIADLTRIVEVPSESQLTQLVDVQSEWRAFVFNKQIRGIKCYSGDVWAMPDKPYIEQVVDTYAKRAYTLDLIVHPGSDGKPVTDILELHDFFSCGLYGFDDYATLLNMWCGTITALLNSRDVVK